MKYLDEYRGEEHARQFSEELHRITTRPHTIMEICGGQTHAIVKFGIDELLPKPITLVHGPGCPVCVTPLELIDKAIAVAERRDVIFCSFGDMLRVPGSAKLGPPASLPAPSLRGGRDAGGPRDLLRVKAEGGAVRIVYSPLDAVRIARENPAQQVVFFAVGFETTAPANALAVYQAHQEGLPNFSILCSHVLVPPAIEAILSSSQNRVQGFLAAGHVCTVMGYTEYEPLAREYGVPIVVTGFEPLDILHGVYLCVKQLEEGRAEVENQYARTVTREGNRHARELIQKIFQVLPRKWRGIGEIPRSGLGLRPEYAAFDAELRFGLDGLSADEPAECISGLVLQGVKKPHECAAFAVRCTPDHPLGAPMVSSEGACAAYYRYRRAKDKG